MVCGLLIMLFIIDIWVFSFFHEIAYGLCSYEGFKNSLGNKGHLLS